MNQKCALCGYKSNAFSLCFYLFFPRSRRDAEASYDEISENIDKLFRLTENLSHGVATAP